MARVASARATSQPAYGAAPALRELADALAQLQGAPAASEPIQRVRAEAGALEGLGALDFARAERLKAGLEQGVLAMRAIARARRAEWLQAWIETAASAVDGIDPLRPLELQRAAIQDALRSLSDAVLVAQQFGSR